MLKNRNSVPVWVASSVLKYALWLQSTKRWATNFAAVACEQPTIRVISGCSSSFVPVVAFSSVSCLAATMSTWARAADEDRIQLPPSLREPIISANKVKPTMKMLLNVLRDSLLYYERSCIFPNHFPFSKLVWGEKSDRDAETEEFEFWSFTRKLETNRKICNFWRNLYSDFLKVLHCIASHRVNIMSFVDSYLEACAIFYF